MILAIFAALFIGYIVGFVTAALCASASRADEALQVFIQKMNEIQRKDTGAVTVHKNSIVGN
jgi:hypothetical protein